MDQKTTKERPIRLDTISDAFIVTTVVLGLIVVWLPYPFSINRGVIFLVGTVTAAVLLVWHHLTKKKLESKIRGFIDSIVGVVAISFVVHFTGGINSYFVFLYFLPALSVAARMSLRYTLVYVGIVYIFLLVQGYLDFGTLGAGALSLTAFHLWSIGLVIAYGRYLAREMTIAQERDEQVRLEQIEEVSNLKDEFVFIISHELRSPITAIRGYLELIMTDSQAKFSEEFKSVLNKAFYTANKLANLVSLLLEISRLETGKIKFYVQKVKLAESIDTTMRGISTDANDKHIGIKVAVPTDFEVFIDAERLIEILTILIENAVRFTPEYGKVNIFASKETKFVFLKISDTGIGITDTAKKHLFNKFYSVSTDDGQQVKGVGLGLYMCKSLLKAMGGDISLESELGKGTTFSLSLPASSS